MTRQKDSERSQGLRAYLPFSRGGLSGLPLGLRLLQIYQIGVVLAVLAGAALIDPNHFTYDLSLVCGVCLTGATVVSVWMVQIRSKSARVVVPAAIIVNNVLMVVDLLGARSFDTLASHIGFAAAFALMAVQVVCAIAAVAYLLFSSRAKEVLSSEYRRDDAPRGNTWDLPLKKRLRTWEFWRDLFVYFFVFSFLGHWAEIAFCWLIRFGLVMGDYDPSNHMLWDQWLFPFSAEGIALVMIVLVLHPFSRFALRKTGGKVAPAVALSFLANALVCTSIDFITGITANADYHLWDYRALPFNFMGQVCLQNSMVYSIAATLIVWVVYPLMDTAVRKLPRAVADGAFWFLAGVYGFCAALHFMYIGSSGFVFG